MSDETGAQQAMLLMILIATAFAVWRNSLPARHDGTLPPAAAEIASLLLRAVEPDAPNAPQP